MSYVRVAGALVLFLVLSLAAAWLYRAGGNDARADLAEYQTKAAQALADAQAKAREQERNHAQRMAAIAEKVEQDKRNAQKDQDLLVAGLRAGTVRLQKRWAGCVSEAGRTAAELDAAARDRETSASAIVRAARDADDTIKRLQEVIRKDREQ